MDYLAQKNFFLVLCFLILTAVLYYPGLSGPFQFDDYTNIVDNQLLHVQNPTLSNFWQASWSGNSSSFGRPLSYFSFSLNSYFSGTDARAMKITNLVIHLSVGILLFFLSRILLSHLAQTRRLTFNPNVVSALACCVWLLHPLNLTCVLYVVQRMASLCALFSVCAMLCYAYFRIQQTKHSGHWLPLILSTSFFSLLAFLTKENAVLLLFYLTCIEIFIFKFSTYSSLDKKILKTCFISFYVITFFSLTLFLTLNSEWLKNGYDFRAFTLTERLLTESRILVWYLKMIIAPSITEMSLYLDDFKLSTSLFQPVSTILSIAFLLFLIIIGFLTQKKFTLIAFGIFWFFSGHLLESTFVPLELAFEHRNYLPSFGIFIAIAYTIERLFSNKKLNLIIAITTITWTSLIGYTTYTRSTQWNNPIALAIYDVEHRPKSPRAHSDIAGVYSTLYFKSTLNEPDEELFSQADFHLKKAASLDTCCSSHQIARLVLYSHANRELPRMEFDNIVQSLSENAIDSSTLNALQKLTLCITEGVCKLSTKDYMTVMYTALSNPGNNEEYLHNVEISLAEYYAIVLDDFDNAIRLTNVIIEEHPDMLHYRFMLVNYLVNSNKTEDALQELDTIVKKDKFRMYTANVDYWKALIESLKKENY